MGTDVYIDGNLTIPAAKVLAAGKLLLEAIGHKDELDPEYLPSCYAEKIKTPEGIVKLLEERFESFAVSLEDDGSLEFGLDDCTRHEEYDQWVFEGLAPVTDDGEFYMSADDYKWMWEIKGGKFREVSAENVYDHDEKAVPTIEKIIAIIYPENMEGRPISSLNDACEWTEALEDIENLLRETGYGPQAGKNELDRLAEV